MELRISGGEDAKMCQETHQVLILTLGGYGRRCGGTILNRLFVLTANHCNVNGWMPCDAKESHRSRLERLECERNIKRKNDDSPQYSWPNNILGKLHSSSYGRLSIIHYESLTYC